MGLNELYSFPEKTERKLIGLGDLFGEGGREVFRSLSQMTDWKTVSLIKLRG